MFRSKRSSGAFALVVALLALMCSVSPASADGAGHVQITASGSSWSGNAVNQWISDVRKQGLKVVFTANGSAAGRQDFANNQTDMGMSDIAYQITDPETGAKDTSNGREYAYLPVVAGGTSFPYNLKVAGKRVTNLRLSGQTLADIFTGKITNWSDQEITKDNNYHRLPSIPIKVVVHSEGSGSTAQFTAYLAKSFATEWTAYNAGKDVATEYYPTNKPGVIPENGSDGVMNFITSAAGAGSIGFDEYSYPLLANFPVAKIRNAAGYYTAPTQYNVAVGLTAAVINQDKSSPDYLTQKLDNVYTNPDPRTYPLSSYSYTIIPVASNTKADSGYHPETKTTNSAARQTIADYLYYAICQGQGEVGKIGYSSIPINLVEAGFAQIAKLKAADPKVSLAARNVSTCNNPTFIAGQPTVNHLAKIAPFPPSCDKIGSGPCTGTEGVDNTDPGNKTAPTGPASAGAGNNGGGQPSGAAGGGPTAGSSGNPQTVKQKPSTHVDANTGGLVTDAPGADGAAAGDAPAADAEGVPTELAATASTSALNSALIPLAIALFVLVLVVPVALGQYLAIRRRRQ